ncbi:MAG: NusA-like transcription termination signal-binding factor [Candidatus Nitrosocosmicus sp.]|uniref:NusA-like transcription termination signal-binding factor n=1 Tax=Candidatus Nitrosocosmicus agrestis TaxID=2563600 RepID=UPI00122E985B|nr:NusA-like transcription termination signal-binding factor [Candidatus Nitrosocosmicus sp. SS]KAA2281965.1 NusA-like transcription termination signal-binding factor [Candidatus Nitrosocosmicus sp. SS]KAF0869870.1 NusA-like transcription termination signal-binding factor [Candidatus Nitrosocosmicus sp. SS]MDR4490662.1 NusA-like transcription termination signal-binding factor [Candidatus Nitrosocosmicus sp.]
MSEKIKLSPDEFRLLSLFQSVTSADARDCILDDKLQRVIFVVNRGQMGMAIGKGGSNIKQLQTVINKRIELVEHSDQPAEFVKNIFNSDMIIEVKINDKMDGSKQALVVVDAKKKGLVVGKDGRNVEKARLLAKRYYNITNVLVISPEQLIKSEKM